MKKHNTSEKAVQEVMSEFVNSIVGSGQIEDLMNPENIVNIMQAGMSALLRTFMLKERDTYLENQSEDRANGYAPKRQLFIKTEPVDIEIPRTRGGFYPSVLPKHKRYLPNEYKNLLEQILLNSKSFKALGQTIQSMGLPYSEKQLDELLEELDERAQDFHNKPLSSDWIIIYIDAKKVDLKDTQGSVKSAIMFTAIGIDIDKQKKVLVNKTYWGNENIECWRNLLKDLTSRGVRRPLMIVTDDFSGVKKLIGGFFQNTDHQLCTVHLLRNAKNQLSYEDYLKFRDRWKEICLSSSFDTAKERWLKLMEELRNANPGWIKYISTRTDNYLVFMKYPRNIQKHIKSTNLPEGINNLIEIVRRNAGGHFHSEREVRIKMMIMINNLTERKWRNPNPMFKYHSADLLRMFKQRFEGELPEEYFLTQTY